MNRWFHFSLTALLMAMLVAAVTASSSQAIGDDDDEVGPVVKKLEEAKWTGRYRPDATTCKYVSKLYRSLFVAAGASGLPKLQTLPEDSIAIQAAWESVALTVPAEPSNVPVPLDAEKLSWFIGFLEGRARVSLPHGWRELVLDAQANAPGNIFPGERTSIPYHDAGADRVRCPINASVEKSANAVLFRIGDEAVTVPEKVIRRDVGGGLYFDISGCFTSQHCFVAVHDEIGYAHEVTCIDRSSGKLLWRSTACGCCWWPIYGASNSSVLVTATEDGRVFVFGAAFSGFYVHGFAAADGKSLLHFSSRY